MKSLAESTRYREIGWADKDWQDERKKVIAYLHGMKLKFFHPFYNMKIFEP